MAEKMIAGIPVRKIWSIDARANDTKKKSNEKPLKVNMDMDDLAKLLIKTNLKKG
jgi:hypothetical protein